MTRCVLDAWITGQLGGHLDMERLRTRQLALLNQSLAWAREHSSFWRRYLQSAPARLTSLGELAALPTISQALLREQGAALCCLPQGDFARVTTLQSSATTGAPKRLYFTQTDLDATVDFFQHGMRHIVAPGRSVMVCMPGDRPGSVGALLREALGKGGVACHVHGFMIDPDALAADVARHNAGCLVALPWQALLLARRFGTQLGLTRVLLSGDRAPGWMVQEIAARLDAEVFLHWGMTETGLGGAVECPSHDGLHLRALDLHVEILHPESGLPQPLGALGEVVVTTLARRGMPLFRYRTGDLARLLPAPCDCGSPLPRLENPSQRLTGATAIHGDHSVDGIKLDESILQFPWVEACVLTLANTISRPRLRVLVSAVSGNSADMETRRFREQALLQRCASAPGVKAVLDAGRLALEVQWASCGAVLGASPPKRRLLCEPNPGGASVSQHLSPQEAVHAPLAF